jgi:tetratricopeptide (TPR) repeat protein
MIEHMKRMGAQMQMGQSFDFGETVQQIEANAWLAYAEGRSDEALDKMRAAASKEKSYRVESRTVPAYEMLGDLLAKLQKPADALAAYRAALNEAPGRFNALYGAARAAKAAGDLEDAKLYYSRLLKNCVSSPARPELVEAKAFLHY